MREHLPDLSFAEEPIGFDPERDPRVVPGKRTRTMMLPRARKQAAATPAPAREEPAAQEEADAGWGGGVLDTCGVSDPFWFAEGTGAVTDGPPVRGGQLDKAELLAELRAAVEQVARAVLGPTWSPARCPELGAFFARQARMPAAHVEGLLRMYTRAQHDEARRYIDDVCVRLPGALRRAQEDPSRTWAPGPSGLPIALERDDG